MRLAAAFACALLVAITPAMAAAPPPDAHHYKNFRVAIYITVTSTKRLADPAVREAEFDRVMKQTRFDKVYLEAYRTGVFATDAEIDSAKAFLESKGVIVSGGITLAKGGVGGQFGTFDYENPADRAECKRAVELAARHFNEIILDDFFFYTSKSDADIVAKGKRSWTQYRLDTMRKVAQELVLGPARAVNPHVRMIIKYPNWYEHFQGLGYDLEKESRMFDAIHTGTETRDPEITDQLLQQYESYEIVRYFDNIRPGRNGGGWVDTYDTRYADRYAEQLWDTMLAKAPEIVLFNWADVGAPEAVKPGDRPWAGAPTSFNWKDMVASYTSSGASDPGPGWGQVAGYALGEIDRAVGHLGNPIGIASYKPYQSSGEDFLQNYLGNIGIPIEMTPEFPAGAKTVLLTQSASFDPAIVAKIKAKLQAGGNVIITSGFLRAMQDKGIEDIVEWRETGNIVSIGEFINGFGAGAGKSLDDAGANNPSILFPEVHFWTNDSWPVIRGVASDKGFPIVLMNRYSKGTIYLLTVPENIGDLYNLPQGVLTQIKSYLLSDFPVRIAAPSRVALFAYDNGSFVVESYRPAATKVTISVDGAGKTVRNLLTGESLQALAHPPEPPAQRERTRQVPPRTEFSVVVQPHSYLVFGIGGASPH
ncbi:MAG TPA: hypothetical protein VG867_02890 [Rhizomicrobium sp.]|nr:hypothetical protein [Rhizomicrobium sp.]